MNLKKRRDFTLPRRGAVAAPGPVSNRADHLRSDGIQDDVPGDHQQVRFLLEEDGFEAALEDMPVALVMAIESLRVDAV